MKQRPTTPEDGKDRRKADYLILKTVEDAKGSVPYRNLVSSVKSRTDTLKDATDTAPAIHFVKTASKSGFYSPATAQALDRCIGAQYLRESDDGYEITEKGKERLEEKWLSHFGISTEFFEAVNETFSEDSQERAQLASD